MDSIWCRGDATLKIQPHFTTNGVVAMRLENFNKLALRVTYLCNKNDSNNND
ncbi:MAG: hypothetical protein ACI8SA_002348 [Dokdonia sp.]|jgi:hypothetical protein